MNADRRYAMYSDTSWFAAHSIPTKRITRIKRAVLNLLRDRPLGLSDDQIATELKEWLYTVAPRRKWLVDAGLVADSGRRVAGPRGRPVTVWMFNAEGIYRSPVEKKRKKLARVASAKRYGDALKKVDTLHGSKNWAGDCSECFKTYPCPTMRILNEVRKPSTGEIK